MPAMWTLRKTLRCPETVSRMFASTNVAICTFAKMHPIAETVICGEVAAVVKRTRDLCDTRLGAELPTRCVWAFDQVSDAVSAGPEPEPTSPWTTTTTAGWLSAAAECAAVT